MTTAVVAACASVFVAVLVFILNQSGQLRQERRQARLTRISSQLRELYGPLNALVDTNERIWESLRMAQLPTHEERRTGLATDDWLRWRNQVLMPTNRRMRDLIIEHADLFAEADVPEPFLGFCAHVASMEVVLVAEADGHRIEAMIHHPGTAYVNYVHETFARLKHEQQQLLRLTAPTSTELRLHESTGRALE